MKENQTIRSLRIRHFIQIIVWVLLAEGLAHYLLVSDVSKNIFAVVLGVLLVGVVFIFFYQKKTGKVVGTRTHKKIMEYERDRLGEKKWQRQRNIGFSFMVLLAILAFSALWFLDLPVEETGRSVFSYYIGSIIGVSGGYWSRAKKIDQKSHEEKENYGT
ncbi:hypothetical protein LCL89_08390 [Halobacillus yeomjeoni]|uniref:hypothetical protein n=1 Tax=Halobacillus yeomjeoni TaxID=311194 RepID=UPI001CD703E9|nr:hypothetical protein [Halobacillus yeomjeoni]MCA0984060.1 hypothetical protein [Halobacillus yeomjeoni]